jgi:hypothetical protein
MPANIQHAKPAKKRKAPPRQLTNARLLKLAAKNRPPKSWYDEQDDPTKPSPTSGQ